MMKQAFQQNVPSLGRIFKESVSYGFMDNGYIFSFDDIFTNYILYYSKDNRFFESRKVIR